MTEAGFARRIGDRWTLALEFEIHGDRTASAWNESWGSLWLWVQGRVVGWPSEIEMVFTGLESLREAGRETGHRGHHLLPPGNDKDALEAIMWVRYGDEEVAPVKRIPQVQGENLLPFEVLPRRTGPFFDGWEGILVERQGTERFIYRQDRAEITSVDWPLGTFRDVIEEGCRAFERLARSLVGPGDSA